MPVASIYLVIDVDTVPSPLLATVQPWVSNLTVDDKVALLNGQWLNDRIINAGQQLIQTTYPHVDGLQDVNFGLTLSYSIKKGEFVQVLHTGFGHWVTVSTIGCSPAEVEVYDSMSPVLTGSMERQISAIMCAQQKAIAVRLVLSLHFICIVYIHSKTFYTFIGTSCVSSKMAHQIAVSLPSHLQLCWLQVDTQVHITFASSR